MIFGLDEIMRIVGDYFILDCFPFIFLQTKYV